MTHVRGSHGAYGACFCLRGAGRRYRHPSTVAAPRGGPGRCPCAAPDKLYRASKLFAADGLLRAGRRPARPSHAPVQPTRRVVPAHELTRDSTTRLFRHRFHRVQIAEPRAWRSRGRGGAAYAPARSGNDSPRNIPQQLLCGAAEDARGPTSHMYGGGAERKASRSLVPCTQQLQRS